MELERDLESVRLFASLGRRERQRLAQQGTRRSYRAGETIVREGDTGTALYVVLSGRVRVERGGSPFALGELGPGQFFGELALIEEHPRSASVVAVEDTECILFAAWEFKALLQEHPAMAVPIMEAVIARLHRAEHRDTTHR
jgi:CRP-like cAMP-binding protein